MQACSETTNCCLEMDAPLNGFETEYECEVDFAAQDSDLTVGVGFLHAQATTNSARCYPDKNFALIDATHPGDLAN